MRALSRVLQRVFQPGIRGGPQGEDGFGDRGEIRARTEGRRREVLSGCGAWECGAHDRGSSGVERRLLV